MRDVAFSSEERLRASVLPLVELAIRCLQEEDDLPAMLTAKERESGGHGQ